MVGGEILRGRGKAGALLMAAEASTGAGTLLVSHYLLPHGDIPAEGGLVATAISKSGVEEPPWLVCVQVPRD